MIYKYEFFHGSVLARLITNTRKDIAIRSHNTKNNGVAYILNNKVVLYVKYSTNRLSPWTFTFREEHQDDINSLKNEFGNFFIALVCNDDGVVCLDYRELKNILDDYHDPTEWLRISRRKREKYSVSGSNGKLKTKIGENEYPSKILKRLV